MANPVLVEVTRGALVESRHRGAVAVCDAEGRALLALGDVARPVFPRSAVKAIQALPLVESGAADACGFGRRALALAQASHGGEAAHVATARAMLAASGLDEAALECGAHAPSHPPAAEALIRAGRQFSAIHNNCSGKHAGFLAVAGALGVPHRGYAGAAHPVQQAVRAALEDVTGAPHGADRCGSDGCSIPTWAVPLASLARGFARFGSGAGLSPARAAAARRICEAAMAEPFYVAGTGRFCTDAMVALAGEALVKTGAEGVFCAALPRLGLGVALKCDDGAPRAAEAMMAAVLARLLPGRAEALAPWQAPPVLSRRDARVGEVRPVAAAFSALR